MVVGRFGACFVLGTQPAARIKRFDGVFVFVGTHMRLAQFLVHFLPVAHVLGGLDDLVARMQVGAPELHEADNREHDGKQPR